MMQRNAESRVGYLDENFCERQPEEGKLSVRTERSRVGTYVERLEIFIKNNGEKRKLVPFFELKRKGRADFFMIPCVNYDGNRWGTGREPKGTDCEGKPWIFSSDRVGLPGCSIAEISGLCTALFADNEGISENASASVFGRGEETVQRIYFSHIEYPFVYLRKFEYGSSIAEMLAFEKGEEKKFVCYLYAYERAEGSDAFGYGELFDFVNGGGYYRPIRPKYTAEETEEMSWEFFRSLTEKTRDGYLSNMGFLPEGEHRMGDETCRFLYRRSGRYEIGWCGQNITAAEMYLRFYKETGDSDCLERGTGILDTWGKRLFPCGLMAVNFDAPFDENARLDTCNEGWLLYKIISCCRILKELGISAGKYENIARGICRFFMENYPAGGFPQIVYGDGSPAEGEGCAGAMLMLGFLAAGDYFGDSGLRERAADAFSFYYDRYLSHSVAAGGALDTCCIDKESAGPVLRSALRLYEITGDAVYLTRAENIAHYLMSWMFYHDVPFDENSDCGRLALRTVGGTSVSVAHHHLDCWGLFYVPDFLELYERTGKKAYYRHARVLWTFPLQYMSDGSLKVHGMVRMRGAQNEAVIQCNWHGEDESKGCLNDWLVAWVKSFQLDVLFAVKDADFFRAEEEV